MLETRQVPSAPGVRANKGVRELLDSGRGSALARYRALTFPTGPAWQFALYELAVMFLLPMPGGLGLLLRRKLSRRFFGRAGRNLIIGRNCVFRHPHRIFIGDRVTIDDACVLDARGCEEEGLHIGDDCIISRGCVIKSKGGPIRIGARVNIGTNSQLISHSGLFIGDDAAIAGGCHINGGTFDLTDFSRPAAQRTPRTAGPIEIGAGAWLATAVTVLDGARIGENAVVSAGSVAMGIVEPRTVVQGNPARKIFTLR